MKLNSPTAYSFGEWTVNVISIGHSRMCFCTGWNNAVEYLFAVVSIM